MNRKFKVWDSIGKKFVDKRDLKNYVVNFEGKLFYVYDGVSLADPAMQIIHSTGKTDKNGIEIYEGDIRGQKHWKYIVCFGDFRHNSEGYNPLQVGFYKEFLDERFGVQSFDFSEDLSKKNIHLGNKFENPELLDKNE